MHLKENIWHIVQIVKFCEIIEFVPSRLTIQAAVHRLNETTENRESWAQRGGVGERGGGGWQKERRAEGRGVGEEEEGK